MHSSIRLVEHPIEFINIVPMNPLISKCQIKVCYVGDTPNRNKSIITKDVARQMANSLPGSPIVGYYNEAEEDFEEHNRIIDISNGKFEIKDTTKPYGFVDLNAKVWFAKYLDDNEETHEYLMTEGWLWTGQYPECQRIINKGNNQSMELDENTLNASWSKDNNGKAKFFIINEAIISKLCILGEDVEPCFEGSQIAAPSIQFSFDDNFKEQMFAMINELKEMIKEGGAKVFTTYAVEIGDALWSALYAHLETAYPDMSRCYCSVYRIEGIFEENGQKFAVLQNRADMKYYRLNFSLTDETGFVPSETLVEVTKSYVPAEEPQFAAIAVEEFENNYAQKKTEEQDKNDKEDKKDSEDNSEGEEKKCPKCGKPMDECECEDEEEDDKKKNYSLEEIPEYIELQTNYSNLETTYNNLVEELNNLKTEYASLEEKANALSAFKTSIEKKEKQEMIASFYMLSDEDKKDVTDNIDTYSLEDIEAKLSIICVRNKVSFNLDDDGKDDNPTVYNLNNDHSDETMPAWVKRAISVAKTLN